jgi:hypothetical protein
MVLFIGMQYGLWAICERVAENRVLRKTFGPVKEG